MPSSHFVHIRESVEFRDLLLRDMSSWPGVSFGMVGYLLLLVLVELTLGPPPLRTLLVLGWRGCWVHILKEIVGNGSLLIILLIVFSLLMFLIILMFGLMVALFLMSYVVLGLVGVVFTLLASRVIASW